MPISWSTFAHSLTFCRFRLGGLVSGEWPTSSCNDMVYCLADPLGVRFPTRCRSSSGWPHVGGSWEGGLCPGQGSLLTFLRAVLGIAASDLMCIFVVAASFAMTPWSPGSWDLLACLSVWLSTASTDLCFGLRVLASSCFHACTAFSVLGLSQ